MEEKVFIVTFKIKTDYSIKELEEVLEKIFEIPGMQYDDCGCFEYKKVLIKLTRKNKGEICTHTL